MIPVSIDALLLGNSFEKSIVVLRPLFATTPDLRVLPIYIGLPEALSIRAALENIKIERPQTHDLMTNIIASLGGYIVRAIIDRVDGLAFYSKLVIQKSSGEEIEIDARPSDAIAMAIRADAPIYVESPVFISSSMPYNPTDHQSMDNDFESFHKFVESLKPEDFGNITGSRE